MKHPTTNSEPLHAPFWWFGGKRRVAGVVWDALGDVDSYIEPFAGSAAVLLARPSDHLMRHEVLNDSDGLLVNVWRALAWCPDETASWADWPATESDLHARHAWLVGERESLTARLEGDPAWCDPRAAGWWLWGISLWLGGAWCSGLGPWHVVDGELVCTESDGKGIRRRRINMIRNRPVGGDVDETDLVPWGTNEQRLAMFRALAERLKDVVICCGDWSRVCNLDLIKTAVPKNGIIGVFLDPPYSLETGRTPDTYAHDDGSVVAAVKEWALKHGDDQSVRIVIAGLDGEYDELPDHGWRVESWSGAGGINRKTRPGGAQIRRHNERLWFSPHCISSKQPRLFELWMS